MKKTVSLFLLIIFSTISSKGLLAHCEVPCGIYGDELRIAMLYEHFTTIEKAMQQIEILSKDPDKNYNQIVRWITTKDDHANEVQHIASQYFITQRIKLPETSSGPEYEKYIQQLVLLHQMSVFAMKTKQTTDLQFVENLRDTLAAFEEIYFEGKHRHKIEQEDH